MIRHSTYLLWILLALPFQAASQNFIGIGLLLPDREHRDIIKAAELAIEQANAEGGYMDREFRLFVRTAEGFWGAGSKESVNLVYEDEVRAIIGSLDGRNGHLAEQVATKSHLAYIETYATEPTLSQAFVPWFKRVVPNDNQQARLIMDQIERNGGGRIGILSGENYDTRFAVSSLSRKISQKTGKKPQLLVLDPYSPDQHTIRDKIIDSKLDHLIIPFDTAGMDQLILSLRESNPELQIYGTLHFAMGAESRKSDWMDYEGIYMPVPVLNQDYPRDVKDSRSAYLYDAFMLVINAIKHAGTGREEISDYLSETVYNSGLTGKISFDELGNRQEALPMARIKNGSPEKIR